MKNLFQLTLIVGIVTSVYSETKPSARDIVDRANKAGKLAGSEAVSTMKIIDAKGRERSKKPMVRL